MHRLRQKRSETLLDHADGILNHCRTEVPLGVGQLYVPNPQTPTTKLRYLLLKADRMAATRTA